MIAPVRTGRPFADYHAAFGRFVRVPFLAGQKTVSAKMAATRRQACRKREAMLRQRTLGRATAAKSALETFAAALLSDSFLYVRTGIISSYHPGNPERSHSLH